MRSTEMDGGSQHPRWTPVVAWTTVAVYVVAIGLTLWFGFRSYLHHAPEGLGPIIWNTTNGFVGVVFATFVVAGALIVTRRPANTVGWIMVAGGVAFGLGMLGDAYALLALGGSPSEPSLLGVAAKFTMVAGLRSGAVLLLVFLPLLYPDGRLPSYRWRPFAWGTGIFIPLWIVAGVSAERLTGSAFPVGREPIELYDIANPLTVEWFEPIVSLVSEGVQTLVLLGLIVVAVGAVAVRFRRSDGIERQQMKWFTFGAGLYVVAFASSIVVSALQGSPQMVQALQGLAYLSLVGYPAAIGVAVLRYRLYEIDRIISRTVSYGLVVAILAGTYAVAVVGLGEAVTAVTGVEDSDLVVAVSTLAAAGLFRPVRTRIQTAVDRRFNRTGYEARRAVDAFTQEVRDEVDLDQIRRQVTETAALATQPTHVSVWLTDRGSER